MKQGVLLSILIPTYNGASKFLDETLKSIIEGVKLCDEGLIEVILSNNASTDNTLELLKQYKEYSFIRYYSNDINIGSARNIIKLTDEYALGEFGWVIGDDDLINPSAMPTIVEVLKKNTLDYLSVGFSFILDRNYTFYNGNYVINYSSFAKAIDRWKPGNVLGTFMSSAIVRLSLFKQVPKDNITPKFDTFQSIFPNAYVNATAFHDKKCAFIREDVVLSFVHEKDWESSDNTYMIVTRIVPALYQYIVSLGVSEKELSVVQKLIIYRAVLDGYIRIIRGKHIDCLFWQIWRKSLMFPSVHLKVVKFFANSFVRKIKGHK